MSNNLRVNIIGDSSKLKNSLSTATSSLKKFGDRAKAIGTTLSTRITLPLAVAGGAAIKMASSFTETLNKVDVAFKNSSSLVRAFGKTTLEQFGIAEGTALDMAATFGDMSTSMGLNTLEAAKLSTALVGLAGDLSSFKDMNIEEVTTALNGVFTGETESLKRLGIVMTETNLKNFALSQGIQKNIKDFTQAEKVQLRFQFVLKNTQNAQGDFARTSDGAANQSRKFTESLKQLGTNIGQILLPSFTKIVTFGNKVVAAFIGLDGDTKKLVVSVGLLTAGLPLLVTAIGSVASAIAFLASPVALTIGLLAGLALHTNEIRNAFNDFAIDIKVMLLNALVKVQSGFEKFLVRIETATKLISRFLQDGFDADFTDIFKEQTNKLADISLKAGAEISENLSGAEILKTYNNLPPTLSVIKGLFDDLADAAGLATVAFDDAAEAAKGIEMPKVKPLEPVSTTGLFDPKPVADFTNKDIDFSRQRIEQKNKESNAIASFNEHQDRMAHFGMAMGAQLGGAFSEVGQSLITSLGMGEGALGSFGAAFITAAFDAVGAALSVASANAIAAASAGSFLAGPVAPIILPALIAGALAVVKSAFSSDVPALARGGIVTAPTLAMVGDNLGAGRGNPEVVAPLNKLQGMIGRTENVNVGGEFRIQGQDLVVALQRADRNRSRIL